LHYALTRREVTQIVMQRLIRVDGKIRTEINYPAGFMDVITIEKTNEHFRLLYDVKGRFAIHRITEEESKYKLCKVKSLGIGPKNIPHLVTHDGRTIRYPDPVIKANDVVKIDLAKNKIVDIVKFDIGNLAMITGGRNLGRIGVIEHRERHEGSYEIIHIKDAVGHKFATRLSNVFPIAKGTTSLVSVPRRKGVKLSVLEEKQRREKVQKTHAA